jgi:hypothetical protein
MSISYRVAEDEYKLQGCIAGGSERVSFRWFP